MPPGVRKTFSSGDDEGTLVGQKSFAKALCGKASNAALDKNDPEYADLYGDLEEAEDDKTDTNGDWPLYSDFFDEPPPSQMELDNVMNVDNDSGCASSVGDDDLDADSDPDSVSSPTALQKFGDSQNEKIATSEEGNTRSKPFPLRGEVSAFARLKGSLFEALLEHDMTVRLKSLVRTQISEEIDHVVKQRIVDGLFDDVIFAPPEHYQATKKRKDVDNFLHILQEKSTKSLAELYAREFTDKQAEHCKRADASIIAQRKKQEAKNDVEKKIKMLLSKLYLWLNALDSVSIINDPQEKSEEGTASKHNVKAILAEESAPDAISSGNMLATHEVFSVKKSDAKGSAELDNEERKRKDRKTWVIAPLEETRRLFMTE